MEKIIIIIIKNPQTNPTPKSPPGISVLPGFPQGRPVFTEPRSADSKEGSGKGGALAIFPRDPCKLGSSCLAGTTQAPFLGWQTQPPLAGRQQREVSVTSARRSWPGEAASHTNLGEEGACEPGEDPRAAAWAGRG